MAGELGTSVGSVYTSLTGFYVEDGTGSIQLLALGHLLLRCKFLLWDLGMFIEHKSTLGAGRLTRKAFREKYKALRAHRDVKLECKQRVNCKQMVKEVVAAQRQKDAGDEKKQSDKLMSNREHKRLAKLERRRQAKLRTLCYHDARKDDDGDEQVTTEEVLACIKILRKIRRQPHVLDTLRQLAELLRLKESQRGAEKRLAKKAAKRANDRKLRSQSGIRRAREATRSKSERLRQILEGTTAAAPNNALTLDIAIDDNENDDEPKQIGNEDCEAISVHRQQLTTCAASESQKKQKKKKKKVEGNSKEEKEAAQHVHLDYNSALEAAPRSGREWSSCRSTNSCKKSSPTTPTPTRSFQRLPSAMSAKRVSLVRTFTTTRCAARAATSISCAASTAFRARAKWRS